MIAQWFPRWNPTGTGPLDNEALGHELSRAAVASQWAEKIRSGRADWEFEPGAKPIYTVVVETAPATDNWLQSSKFISPTDTNNANDLLDFTLTPDDTTFQRLLIPTACQAITNKAGVAKAIMWAIVFRVGTAGNGVVTAPSGASVAGQALIRDDSFVLADNENIGFPFACPTSTKSNTILSGLCVRSCAIVRNVYNTSLAGYYVQTRIGSTASFPAAAPGTTRLSLRLMGYYV